MASQDPCTQAPLLLCVAVARLLAAPSSLSCVAEAAPPQVLQCESSVVPQAACYSHTLYASVQAWMLAPAAVAVSVTRLLARRLWTASRCLPLQQRALQPHPLPRHWPQLERHCPGVVTLMPRQRPKSLQVWPTEAALGLGLALLQCWGHWLTHWLRLNGSTTVTCSHLTRRYTRHACPPLLPISLHPASHSVLVHTPSAIKRQPSTPTPPSRSHDTSTTLSGGHLPHTQSTAGRAAARQCLHKQSLCLR